MANPVKRDFIPQVELAEEWPRIKKKIECGSRTAIRCLHVREVAEQSPRGRKGWRDQAAGDWAFVQVGVLDAHDAGVIAANAQNGQEIGWHG